MLELFMNGGTVNTPSFEYILTIIGASLGLGLLISLVYMFTHRKAYYSQSFTISLIMLPSIIAIIIVLIGSNVASAFSMAGAFSLIRFRSTPGDSKDIAYVFFSLAVGLACGMGFVVYAALFAVILCVVMIVLMQIQFGVGKQRPLSLKVTVPEDLEYHGMFDDVLETYAHTYKLMKVKTAEFGSLFEVTYEINMKDVAKSKELIDSLRTKNGNLKIMLMDSGSRKDGF